IGIEPIGIDAIGAPWRAADMTLVVPVSGVGPVQSSGVLRRYVHQSLRAFVGAPPPAGATGTEAMGVEPSPTAVGGSGPSVLAERFTDAIGTDCSRVCTVVLASTWPSVNVCSGRPAKGVVGLPPRIVDQVSGGVNGIVDSGSELSSVWFAV